MHVGGLNFCYLLRGSLVTISSVACSHVYGDENGPARPADKRAPGLFSTVLDSVTTLPAAETLKAGYIKTSSGEISKGQKETSRSVSREVAKSPRSLSLTGE